ncbi:MAG: hypothetical protein FJ224_09875, partial [Lentisphaerae bacterium]|nr:hypothetical protein [Lentisphaerota bacterium]
MNRRRLSALFSLFNCLVLVMMFGLAGAALAQNTDGPDGGKRAAAVPAVAKKPAAAQAGDQLDTLVAKAGMDVALSAADMARALNLAATLGRPHAVEPIVKTFLDQTSTPSPELLKLAAENAWLAGDYASATVRQKLYVLALTDKTAASAAAARLYQMLLLMGDTRALVAFMTQHGEALRAGPAARKYDRQYLDEAWEGKDLAVVAKWLVLCFADKLPLAQEQELFWDDLDRLIESTKLPDETAYRALPDMRKLADLIRESPLRAARLRFQAETIGFNAGARGKDAAQLETDFAPVAAAAKAWFDAAPRGETLRAICQMWSGGFARGSMDQWNTGGIGKRKFFAESFMRLSDEERLVAADGRYASHETWIELIKAAPPSPARNRWAADVPILFKATDPAAYRALAPALAGIENRGAAIIRSVAAGEDYGAMIKHFVEQESWMFGEVPAELEAIYLSFPPGGTEQELNDRNNARRDEARRVYARYVVDVLFKSPIPLMADNQHLLGPMWQYGERARMPEYLHLLDWVPLSANQRAQAFKEIRRDFDAWSERVRREENHAKKSPETKQQWEAEIALVKRIDDAFRAVMDPKVFDASKAPSLLLGHILKMNLAAGQNDAAAALAAARRAYALIRDYDEKKLPFGSAYFDLIVRDRGKSDAWDIQAEVYGDQIARLATTGRSQHARVPFNPDTEDDPDRRAKFEASVAKVALAMLDAGTFDGAVFDIYRRVRLDRSLQSRSESEASRKIFGKLVDGKVLQNHPNYSVAPTSPDGGRYNAATKYQWLLGREFPGMNSTYPRDSYFDDVFAEEVAKTGLADPMFWRESGDKSRKGANAAAAGLKRFAKLPFGYDDSKPVYRPRDFWTVVSHVVSKADSDPRNEMLAAAEAAYGTTRFDDCALGRTRLESIDPKAPDARRQWFDQLNTVLDRAATLPRPVSFPGGLEILKPIREANDVTDAELAILVRMFKELQAVWFNGETLQAGIELIQDGLLKRGRTSELMSLAPAFCAAALRIDRGQHWVVTRPFAAKTESFAREGHLPLAATYSRAAQFWLRNAMDGGQSKTIESIGTMALLKLGGASTSVGRGDSRYGIYAAQQVYAAGKYEDAWRGYAQASELLESEIKKLDPGFVFWVAGEAIRRGETDEAGRVTRLMMSAVHKGDVILAEVDDRANLELIYADIALAGEQYPLAKSQYERIALNADYAGTRTRMTAELRVAEVLRLTADYGGAEAKLEALRKSSDKNVAAEASYMMARVKSDQSQYGAAREFIEETLRLNPNAVEAKLLEGEINLKIGKLMEGTRLEISDLTTAQRVLIPGRSLSIQIEDRSLSVIGTKNAIEVRVWTEGGDQEVFNLLPFGDSKTKFNGQIATELGAPIKQNNLLQVLGGDKVYYDFSERFRQANKMPLKGELAPPVTVVSDSQLAVSSGEIVLTEGEDKELRLQALARRASGDDLRSAVRNLDQIKPGNPINVHVIDADRSTTAEKDSIVLTATASSGDTVTKLVLTETEPVSGVFVGVLQTAAAAAAAHASDSNPGADPAFAISGGEHPPWVALADNRRPKHYAVDMNDRVALKRLSIRADVPGRGLTKFLVQTSMTGDGFETVGSWPAALKPWDGSLQVTAMQFPIAMNDEWQRLPVPLAGVLRVVREYMALGGLAPDSPEPVVLPGVPSVDDFGTLNRHMNQARIDYGNGFVLHLRGGFYLDGSGERTIRALAKDVKGHILLVDGEAVAVGINPEELATSRFFEKGAHRIDYYLWTRGVNALKPSYRIEWDIPEAPYFAAIPAEAFDVAKHPEIGAKLAFAPASVTTGEENKTFDVAFAEHAEARLVRLALLDFEGDAPAIGKLTVHDTQDRQVLPTAVDLLSLRNNDVLETNPGDTITVSYEDPTPIVPANRVRSAHMKATYTTAGIGAFFMQTVEGKGGRLTRGYTPMRRFRAGHVINIRVQDADADVSGAADTVPLKVRTSSGTELEIKALEESVESKGGASREAVHTGTFLARVFPVEGVPQREGEVQLLPEDGLTFTYLDRENMDKGIPWERSTFVEQAGQGLPVLRVSDVESALLPEDRRLEEPLPQQDGGKDPGQPANEMEAALAGEFVPVLRTLMGKGRESAADAKPATAHVLGSVVFDVTWPAIALSGASKVTFYAQSHASRRLAGVTDPNVFDPTMPGTVPLSAKIGGGGGGRAAPGYNGVTWRPAAPVDQRRRDRPASDMDLGVFMCRVGL